MQIKLRNINFSLSCNAFLLVIYFNVINCNEFDLDSELSCSSPTNSKVNTNTECQINPKIGNTINNNHWGSHKRYILYNVNPGEGFNLRRDVYMRIAGLVRKLIKEKPSIQWFLVLPPWGPLYHWEINDKSFKKREIKIPWSHFFDIDSLNYYIPVLEFNEYLKEHGASIDVVYYLQQEDWNEGQEWKEKSIIEDCKTPTSYYKVQDGYSGNFWGYNEVVGKDFHCVTAQGYASTLKNLIEDYSSIMIDRAEIILHDNFGDSDYWAARRSMRFAAHLQILGDTFRRELLNSTDELDRTVKGSDWREMKAKHGEAKGGPYIGVHLRRRDFVINRKKHVPTLSYTVKQLKTLQKKLKINKIFLATDAPKYEVDELKKQLPDLLQYVPTNELPLDTVQGSVAIIEQWICAHARFFIGTFESTFSFRIQEEREILGFLPTVTFNRLCGDDEHNCEQPAKWKIVY